MLLIETQMLINEFADAESEDELKIDLSEYPVIPMEDIKEEPGSHVGPVDEEPRPIPEYVLQLHQQGSLATRYSKNSIFVILVALHRST